MSDRTAPLQRGDAHAPIRELLMAGVQVNKLVCPKSLGATDETLDLPELWQPISNLHEELSMGIEFLDPKTIRQREAFDIDPQTLRDELFAGGIRVVSRFGPMDVRREEVAREKAKETSLQPAYDQARALGHSFGAQAADEMEAMVRWVLGPLADPGFEAELARKHLAATRGLEVGDYGPISKLTAAGERKAFADALVDTFPALSTRAQEFAKSDELTDMPALRYRALLRAGLATMPKTSCPARRWLRH